MLTILRVLHGSHLYGTNTGVSDVDVKEVFIPSADAILLRRSPCITQSKKAINGLMEKNRPGEIETESFSLDKFVKLFCEGQSVAVETLFATPILEKLERSMATKTWYYLWNNRDRLISRKSEAFIGYAYKQAAKYGIKGSRVAAARQAVELIEGFMERGNGAKLFEYAAELEKFASETEHCAVVDVPLRGQDKTARHLEVCGRKTPYTATIKVAHEIYSRVFNEYGARARLADTNDGIDWKALSHAVRVGSQSLEYLRTGNITLPRPDASHLLNIKLGLLKYQAVAEEIEELLTTVKEAAKSSTLPEHPDYEWCDQFIMEIYTHAVLRRNSLRRRYEDHQEDS